MTVYLVGAGPGDPGLLTRKGADVLGRADVVVYDRLVDPSLLLLAPRGAILVDVGKQPGQGREPAELAAPGQDDRQREINRLLVDHGRAGRTVVRLKGGDPFLFGRGGEEAEALTEAGVEWEVVPGVASALAAPAVAGVPVTHRGLSTSVTVATGHVGEATAPGGVDWESLGRAGGTLVVLMGMATRGEIARRLVAAGRAGSTPVVVVERGTTPEQRVERTTLDALEAVELGSPAVIVIGAVAGLGLAPPRHKTRPLSGVSVVVTRPRGVSDQLASALGAAGARVIPLAVLEIVDPEDVGAVEEAAANLGRYRWVVFTSANAVRRFVPRARDAREFAGAKLAAVGPATAAALADHHLVADLVPDRADAAGLADVFPPADAAGERVLFPAAAGAKSTVPEGLGAKGWVVDKVTVYRTVAAPSLPDAVLPALRGATAVTFASPSAVEAYVGMRTAGGEVLPVPPVVACIGPVTTAAAVAAGLTVAVECREPSPEALVAGLALELGAAASP